MYSDKGWIASFSLDALNLSSLCYFRTPIPEEKPPKLKPGPISQLDNAPASSRVTRPVVSLEGKKLPPIYRVSRLVDPVPRPSMSTPEEQLEQKEQIQAQKEEQAVAEAKQDAEKKEQQDDAAKEEGEVSETNGADDDSKEDAAAATGAPKVEVAGEDAPLTKILEQLDQLSEKEQESIKENLERISTYPKELPLSQSWSEPVPAMSPFAAPAHPSLSLSLS